MVFEYLVGGAALGISLVSIFLYNYHRKFKYDVFIFEPSLSGLVCSKDKAGVFYDKKSKHNLLVIKKAKYLMDPDAVEFSQGKREFFHLLKTGQYNYEFLKPTIEQGKFNLSEVNEDVTYAKIHYNRSKGFLDKLKQRNAILSIAGVFVFTICAGIMIFSILHQVETINYATAMFKSASNIMTGNLTDAFPSQVIQ